MQRINIELDNTSTKEFTSLVKEFSDINTTPVRRAVDKLAFLEKLNTAIELQPLLAIYAQELSLRLPITGLEFDIDRSYQLKYSQASKHLLESELAINDKIIGSVKYLSSAVLSAPLRQIIASLEEQLLQPLSNVLTFEKSKRLSYRDYLTDLGNRSYYEETLANMKATAQREQRSFSVMLLDLDNFKSVNDTHGHNEGDRVLREFSKILSSAVRTNDYVFRFGGDEFVLLLAHAERLNPSLVASRILQSTIDNDILNKHNVTTSIGFTNWRDGDSSAQLTERADKGLYQSKKNGKNTYFAC